MCRYEGCTDEELILRMRSGETEIVEYLLEKYKELVKNKARSLYLIGGEREDLIQEGMIGLFSAMRDYDHEKNASFQTFASLCVERQLYKAIEASNRLKNQPLNSYISLSEELSEEELDMNWGESPESIVVTKEQFAEKLERLRKKCSPFENHVLTLYISGYDYKSIAEMMDKSPKSIDNAFQRIRQKIKE